MDLWICNLRAAASLLPPAALARGAGSPLPVTWGWVSLPLESSMSLFLVVFPLSVSHLAPNDQWVRLG